jgi:hypothetical protein
MIWLPNPTSQSLRFKTRMDQSLQLALQPNYCVRNYLIKFYFLHYDSGKKLAYMFFLDVSSGGSDDWAYVRFKVLL